MWQYTSPVICVTGGACYWDTIPTTISLKLNTSQLHFTKASIWNWLVLSSITSYITSPLDTNDESENLAQHDEPPWRMCFVRCLWTGKQIHTSLLRLIYREWSQCSGASLHHTGTNVYVTSPCHGLWWERGISYNGGSVFTDGLCTQNQTQNS